MFCQNCDLLSRKFLMFEASLIAFCNISQTNLVKYVLSLSSVSYTHLDVYKRQSLCRLASLFCLIALLSFFHVRWIYKAFSKSGFQRSFKMGTTSGFWHQITPQHRPETTVVYWNESTEKNRDIQHILMCFMQYFVVSLTSWIVMSVEKIFE